MDKDKSPSKSISTQGNVFTGNVSSISGSSSSLPITTVDPNSFIWSQFFIGLFLIPIFAGFIMSLTTFVADDMNDSYYSDSTYSFSDTGVIIISDDEYNTWGVIFDIPEVDLNQIEERDYWFSTSFNSCSDGWCHCFFDMDMRFDIQVESDDGSLWHPMKCEGDLQEYTSFFRINDQTFTYATDYESILSYASVNGDNDISLDSILLTGISFLIPLIYILIIIGSFIKDKKSLGYGLLGGIIVAPISFCFSIIALSFIFWESG